MTQLYSLYTFKDDGPDEDPEGPAFIGPIPTIDIRTIRGEHIPRASRLLDLMEDMDRTDAFVVWASETLGMYERARAVQEQYGFDLDALEAARADVRRVWPAATASKRGFSEIHPQLRGALRPFIEQGMSMRAMSIYLTLPLVDVVKVVLNGSAVRRAEQIADLEEAVMGGALERVSTRALLMEHGMGGDFALLSHLCEMHGVDAKAARTTRDRVRAEAQAEAA